MNKLNKFSEDVNDIRNQEKYAHRVMEYTHALREALGHAPKAHVNTFGCQQNEADSERLLGTAISLGFEKTDLPEEADLVIFNTCAVREHAELRALSRTGALKHLKENNRNLLIGLWGCMVTQEHRKDDIKMKYPYVDFVGGTNMLHRLPEILCDVIESDRRRYYVDDTPHAIVEGVPVERSDDIKAYVSIMYGCNNFCTYCVVPHVRGRERSRERSKIIEEVKELIASGYRDITLLGQNVNSYGTDRGETGAFASLLSELASLDGDFTLRFMTSHPKDASDELFDVIAKHPKISRHFHLPMQSGSSDILSKMNRKYSAEKYLDVALRLKEKVPDIALTTDIIVGFPGETEEDFEKTLEMVERLRFDSIFAFIFSPRKGTPAFDMESSVTDREKSDRMRRLLDLQTEISASINSSFVTKTVSALCESKERGANGMYSARTSTNKVVFFEKCDNISDIYGKTIKIKITRSTAAQLYGEITE